MAMPSYTDLPFGCPPEDRRSSWTEERVAKLKELFAENLTFGEIAKEIGGFSRNAVIGKAGRLGLKRGKQPPPQYAPRPRPRPRSRQTPFRASRVSILQTERIALEPEHVENPTSFFDLEPHHCRWPISGSGMSTLFCGTDKVGVAYCLHHCRLAYQPPKRLTRSELEIQLRIRKRAA